MEKSVCVTGAGGYIASWLVSELLERGYMVHGTVRDPADEKKNGHLRSLPGASERLKLFKADVLDFESLRSAIHGCVGVFHTVCPVLSKIDDPQDVLRPAIEGTRNVMIACRQESIKRVVFTSSGGAVGYDPKRPKDAVIDESCWSDAEQCKQNQSWYTLAKVQSEMLAWELAKEHSIDLVSVIPVLVLGPILQSTINTSLRLVTSLIDGSSDAYALRSFPIVDVRDVARTHVEAFESPDSGGQRYLCANEAVSSEELLESLKKHFPDLPHSKRIGEAGITGFKFSNKKVLGLIKEFTPLEKTLVDTVTSVQERGLL